MARIAAAALLALALAAIASAAAPPKPDRPIVFASNRSLNHEPWHDVFVVDHRGRRTDVTATPRVDEIEPAWAPDGVRLVMTVMTYPQDLFVLNTRTHARTRLTTAQGEEHAAAWSPDGENIAFVRSKPLANAFTLVVRSVVTGAEHVLATIPHPYYPVQGLQFAWSPDGRWLAFPTGDGPIDVSEKDGSARRQLVAAQGYPRLIAWLSDGVVVTNPSGNGDELAAVSLDGTRRALQNPCNPSYNAPTFSGDGAETVCPAPSRPPAGGVCEGPYRVAFRSAMDTVPLGTAELQPRGHAVALSGGSLQGGRFAYAAETRGRDADLWLLSPDGGNAVELTSGPGADREPAWSSDGHTVVFTRTDCHGESDLFTVDTRTHHVHSLGVTGGDPDLEPGGKRIAYSNVAGVWVLNLRTRDSVQLGRTGFAVWRPHSHTLALVNSSEIDTIGADGRGRRYLVAASDIRDVAWSPDGQAIAFATEDELNVFRRGRLIHVVDSDKPNSLSSVTWSRNGASLVYATEDGSGDLREPGAHESWLWSVRAAGGKPRLLSRGSGADMDPAWRR